MRFSRKEEVTVNDWFVVLKKISKFNAFRKYISLKDSVVFTYVAYNVLNL